MADMYGISNAVMEQNSLHGQIELERENRQLAYNKKLTAFNNTIKKTKAGDNTETEKDTGENVGDIQDVITASKGLYGGFAGAGRGGAAGARAFRTSPAMVARKQQLATRSVAAQDTANAAREAEQDPAGAFLGETGRVMEGADEGLDTTPALLQDAGRGLSSAAQTTGELAADGTRFSGAVLSGAGRGFVSGADEMFGGTKLPTALGGEGMAGLDTFKTAEAGGQGLSGVEGIVQKGIVKLGGGEDLGVVAGKGAGAVGGFIDAGEQIDSLVQTGGKSMFTRVDAQGNRVAMSGTDKASEILTEAGSALDVASAFTGGLLVPLAGAVSLAGAITGIIGDYEDQKADNKKVGINADGSTDASKAPKLSDTALPTGEAFTSLGFVGNMSHNPLTSI